MKGKRAGWRASAFSTFIVAALFVGSLCFIRAGAASSAATTTVTACSTTPSNCQLLPYEFTVISATQTTIDYRPFIIAEVRNNSNQTLSEWLWAYLNVQVQEVMFFAPATQFTAGPGAVVTVDLDLATDIGGNYTGDLYVIMSPQVYLSAGFPVSGYIPWGPSTQVNATTTSASSATEGPVFAESTVTTSASSTGPTTKAVTVTSVVTTTTSITLTGPLVSASSALTSSVSSSSGASSVSPSHPGSLVTSEVGAAVAAALLIIATVYVESRRRGASKDSR